jgi:hypothetical protein
MGFRERLAGVWSAAYEANLTNVDGGWELSLQADQ